MSALAGTRELMTLGSRRRDDDDVFLLSTTHGGEVCSLAAAIATIDIYCTEPVVEHLYRQGERLAAGLRERRGRPRAVRARLPGRFPVQPGVRHEGT